MHIVSEVNCSKCGEQTGLSHGAVRDDFVCFPCMTAREPRQAQPAVAVSVGPGEGIATRRPPRLVTDFTPKGRSGLFIYAVVLRMHPDKVKIGMTRKWHLRRKSYANWDLSPGDAISEERVFRITEEFVDLEKLESHILTTFDAPIAFGAEWFRSNIDDASRHIDRVMCAHGISYDM